MKLGYKNTTAPGTVKGYKADKIPPSLTLNEKDLPEIKDWKVGETYHLEMDVKLVSQSNDSMMDNGMNARFEVQDVQVDDDADESGGGDNAD